MKIAVTYDNGSIFQHFGSCEFFKLYDIENDVIKGSEVISADGSGHGALGRLLADKGVDVLICGGIGEGAKNALEEAGILFCSGAEGNADAAVEAFLSGTLRSQGANCDHHHDDGGCGGGCGGGASHGCGGGGCGGCHGAPVPIMEGKNVGKTCKVHYKGTFNDGTQFDSSYDRGEPLAFICGVGMMIRGFDEAVAEMEPGEIKEIHLMPEDAYGMPDPNAIFTVEISQLPGAETLEAGQQAYLTGPDGRPFPVQVAAKDETTITFDANHEMAGKELNFSIELVEIAEEN